jgi:hypothetical protein
VGYVAFTFFADAAQINTAPQIHLTAARNHSFDFTQEGVDMDYENMSREELIAECRRKVVRVRLTPHLLLDTIKAECSFKNDRALAAACNLSPEEVSKVRNQKKLPPGVILRLHEGTKIPVARIRELAA